MQHRSWASTDTGRVLTENHDGCYTSDEHGVYAVADGAGVPAGEFASLLVMQAVAEAAHDLHAATQHMENAEDPARARREVFDLLQGLFERANSDLYNLSRDDANLKGASTTATVLLLAEGGAFLVHVGDTRAYLLRQGELQRLTEDHTLVEEMVRAGKLRREDTGTFRYKNVVSRALGERAVVQVDVAYVDAMPGDVFVLCTDGLTDYSNEVDVKKALTDGGVLRPATRLCDLGNQGGGGDNVTVVVLSLPAVTENSTIVADLGPIQHTARLEALGQLFFCQHLNAEERMKVLRYVQEVRAAAGTTLVRQGEPGSDLYLVVQGALDVWVDGSKVHTIGPGGHFGEIALVSGQPRSATVVARETVRLFRLGREDFFDLSRRDQSVAVKMLWAFTQSLAGRVMDLSRQVAARK
jgi:serine/threonine protein phosphatase PrpC/CRP-like cAMP-binding protein